MCKWRHPKCKWKLTAAVAKYVASPGSAKIFSTKELWKLVQTHLSVSLSTLVHGLCRVPGRNSSLGLGKNFEPVSPSRKLFTSSFPVLTTRFQIWIAQGDVMSLWKGSFVPVEGMKLWQSWEAWGHGETTVDDCGHCGPLPVRPDDYIRWYGRGESHSMLLRIDSDLWTWSVLCVTGQNTACHLRHSWS